MQVQNPPSIIEPDDGSSASVDSAFEASLTDASHTTSLRSSIQSYIYENGRRYHSYRQGEYILPNDEDEQDRMDLSHHVYKLLLSGELYLAPIKKPQRALDLGTGTGIWAIDFADLHPECEILGIDLSPIQPSWVPPNCNFEIDDFEQEWAYKRKFHYIHGRELEGSIRDHDRLFVQCLSNLQPGGWFEMQSIEIGVFSDDGSHLRGSNVLKIAHLTYTASKQFGKDMQTVPTWKSRMEKAGFVNVTERVFKLPQNPWPKDPKMKELGMYHNANIMEAIPAYTMALFTRVLKWRPEEVQVLLASARNELRDTSIHFYTNVYFVFGQKPE